MKANDLNLAELMDFSHGWVGLHGRRLIIHDLSSLAQFRRDLIEALGMEEAQRILTRKGFFWGQADAAAMQRLFQWDTIEEWLKAGTKLNGIEGLAEAEMSIRSLNKTTGSVEIEMAWKNSFEVEQQRAQSGKSAYPICWALVGYASGYASYCLGKSVYFVELQCQATESPCCLAIGKDIDSWGKEIEPYLSFFHAADIQNKVKELTAQIRKQQEELSRQKRQLKENAHAPEFAPAGAQSHLYQQTLELAERVAQFDTTVLITGETGCGKEVLARHIHQCSTRSAKPMLAINCSALPETLLESELFGYKAGAFTGATRNHAGLFEEADGGTVFLDEIGDITPAMQMKLLRVLQEREIKRVGESYSRPVDVRVISATNQDLHKLVAEGKFREDLYFRLHVVQIKIPPLRERRDDILPLARHFLKRNAKKMRLVEPRLAPACVDILLSYPWPGNVRELENTLEHAAIMCVNHIITPDTLPIVHPQPKNQADGKSPYRSLNEVELEHIQTVLRLSGGNRAEAAKILQIGEATLYRKLKQLPEGL
jgi:DNA-binding NtrC family response regulator/predicted hydrocarbon binding protein